MGPDGEVLFSENEFDETGFSLAIAKLFDEGKEAARTAPESIPPAPPAAGTPGAENIVILGGGAGGVVAAHKLRKRLGENHRIVVIDRSADHLFQSSLLWLMVGDRRKDQIRRPLERLPRSLWSRFSEPEAYGTARRSTCTRLNISLCRSPRRRWARPSWRCSATAAFTFTLYSLEKMRPDTREIVAADGHAERVDLLIAVPPHQAPEVTEGRAPRLVRVERGPDADPWALGRILPIRSPYATTVWDYINRGMPLGEEGTLTADEVYALTAYLLSMNGVIAEDAVMDRESLRVVVMMPNRDNWAPLPDWKPGMPRLPDYLY